MTNQQLLTCNSLWAEYQENKNGIIKEKLIERYLPLVKTVAGRIAVSLPQYVDRDDLISNGFFGLLEAIDRYDPARGVKFETYAAVRIRGSILDGIRAEDWVPLSVRQKARNFERTVAELEHKLGRSATDREIATALNISESELHSLVNQLNVATVIPLEEYIKTEREPSQLANPAQYVELAEVREIIARTIDRLSEKEKLVVTLYYYEELTLREISVIMKLSEARISQLHTKAIFRLRGALSRVKASLI
mgnify:CR=1 FL=1